MTRIACVAVTRNLFHILEPAPAPTVPIPTPEEILSIFQREMKILLCHLSTRIPKIKQQRKGAEH